MSKTNRYLSLRAEDYKASILRVLISRKWKITESEYLKGRDKQAPLDDDMKRNMFLLLCSANEVRLKYGKAMFISSGYRPATINAGAGGAKRSAHLTCEAVDFEDNTKEFGEWCMANIPILEEYGLYMESLEATHKGPACWVHLQTRPTKNRIFIP